VSSLAFTSDGRLITDSDDRTVRTWDASTGKELSRVNLKERAWHLTVSPAGDLLAGAQGPSQVNIWEAKTGREIFRLRWSTNRTGGMNKVRFTADEQRLLTFGSDWYVRSWDTLTGKLKIERRFRPESLGPEPDPDRDEAMEAFSIAHRGVDLGPDGNTLVMAVGKHVTVFNVDTGKERFKIEADSQHVTGLALSSDGNRLVTAGTGPPMPKAPAGAAAPARFADVTVWHMIDAKPVCRFRVIGALDLSGLVAFTPDSKRIVTLSGDEFLRFWDAASGDAVGAIELPRRPMRLAFGGNQRLAVAFQDPTVLIYDLATAIKPVKKE
jgi:WD40 repeat protein